MISELNFKKTTHNFISFVLGARRIVLQSHSRFSQLFDARCVLDAWPCGNSLFASTSAFRTGFVLK